MDKKFITSLAKEAGEIMRKYVNNVDISIKEDESIVTQADKEINQLVIDRIKKHFSTHDIYGEESSDYSNNSEYLWVCDPIDGTIPFSNDIPVYVFSLALVQNGVPILGVIYEPCTNKLYFAQKDKGAYCNDNKINVNSHNELKHNYIGFTSWNKAKYLISPLYSKLINLGMRVFDIGSIAYMGTLVASGKFCGIYFPQQSVYDVAAIKLIIDEAGGKCSDIYGEDQRYDVDIKGFIASNRLVHDNLVELVKEYI